MSHSYMITLYKYMSVSDATKPAEESKLFSPTNSFRGTYSYNGCSTFFSLTLGDVNSRLRHHRNFIAMHYVEFIFMHILFWRINLRSPYQLCRSKSLLDVYFDSLIIFIKEMLITNK